MITLAIACSVVGAVALALVTVMLVKRARAVRPAAVMMRSVDGSSAHDAVDMPTGLQLQQPLLQ